jgi:hypothetical protein
VPLQHIPKDRLFEVATTRTLFTPAEYDHLKECSPCFRQWADFKNGSLGRKVKTTDPQFPKADH